jgi:multidrug efflux pump subunit AcrA (membrane-fusion protein)
MEEPMKHRFSLIFLIFVSLFILSACDANSATTETPMVYDSELEDSLGMLIADGEIVPAKNMEIISLNSGVVEELLVEEGQSLMAGDVIIRLEIPQQLISELGRAELEQLKAQQVLDELLLYGNLQKQKAYQRILDAQSARNAALAAWDDLDKEKYDLDLDKLNEKIIDAKQDLKEAKDDLANFLDLDEDNPLRKRRQDTFDNAQISLNSAELEFELLEINYNQVKLNVEITTAELDTASTEYQKFSQNDFQKDQKEIAEKQFSTANAQIDALHAAISDMEIKAPFDGKMVFLNVQKGEWIRVGQLVSVIADDSSWFVESTDINELDVVRIQIGDLVTVELEAFPGERIEGKVVEITEYPQLKYNDVIYPVRIQLDENNLPLRWKMSVIIKFTE